MKINVAGLSNSGMKREHNEDFMLVDKELNLYLICDGMGGHAKGEVASKMCSDYIQAILKKYSNELEKYKVEPTVENKQRVKFILDKAIQHASEKISVYAAEKGIGKGIGTTLSLMIFLNDHAFISHVGDSRIYNYRDNQIFQLTTDHTYRQQLLEEGELPEEIELKQIGHVLTQAVGFRKTVKVEHIHYELSEGDRFYICSDGFSEYHDENLILDMSEKPVEEFVTAGINHANEMGGKDNISIIAIEVQNIESTFYDLTKKYKLISDLPFFKQLSYSEVSKVLDISEIITFKKGENIVIEGEVGDQFYVILNGQVEVSKEGQVLTKIQSGGYFGEMSVIDKKERSATISTLVESQVLTIKRDAFFALIKKESYLGVKVLWSFSKRLSYLLRQQNNYSNKDGEYHFIDV